MTDYAALSAIGNTPQNQPDPARRDMVKNHAGGYGFNISPIRRLERFLFLGSDSNTYYSSKQALTADNAANIIRLIQSDQASSAYDVLHRISTEGLAPREDPSLFTFALFYKFGSDEIKRRAYDDFIKIVRTGEHLLYFMSQIEALNGGKGGYNRSVKAGIRQWFNFGHGNNLFYQATKYRKRHGKSMSVALRLAHMDFLTDNSVTNLVDKVSGHSRAKVAEYIKRDTLPDNPPDYLKAYDELRRLSNRGDITGAVLLIKQYGFTHEQVPNEIKSRAEVWTVLAENMPIRALIRNLSVMRRLGLLTPGHNTVDSVITHLRDEQALKASRIHPLNVYTAIHTLRKREGELLDTRILDALEHAFEVAYGILPFIDKRMLIAVDISGSMQWEKVNGFADMSSSELAAIMSMLLYTKADKATLVEFNTDVYPCTLPQRIDTHGYVSYFSKKQSGGTNCAAPIKIARERNIEVDAIVLLTDNESWSGRSHVHQEMERYRQKINPKAAMITMDFEATDISVAAPDDPLTLSFAGFDASAPAVLDNFLRQIN